MAVSNLPNLWDLTTIGNVADVVMGQSPPSETYNTNGVGLPFFQGKAEFGVESPTVEKWCSSPTRIADIGDILLSVRAPVGPTNLANQRCGIGRGLAAIRAKSDLVDPIYLLYYFRFIEPELVSLGSGSTFSAINRKDIETFRIPLPPLLEQHYIVDILRQTDALRLLREDANKKSKLLQSALFYEIFGDPDPEQNTHGWDIVKIGDTINVGTGGTPSRSIKEYYGGPHNWVKTTELRNETIYGTEETLTDKGLANSNAKIYPINTVLVAMYGQGQTRGRTAKLGVPASVNQACGAFPPSEELLPDYVWHWFQNSYERIRSMSRGGSQENLNLQILKDLYISKPPLGVQQKFITAIEQYRIVSKSTTHATKIFDDLFLSIISRALTGEFTASWREKHIDELQRATVEQDKKSWHQDEEVAVIRDVTQSNVATEKENRFIEQLASIETIFKMVRNNIRIGVQPYSLQIRSVVKVLMENETFSMLIRLAQEISDQTIVEKSIQKTINTSDASLRNWLSFVFPYTPALSPLISRVNAPIEEYAIVFIEYMIAQASSASERIELEKEMQDVQLSPKQKIIFDKMRTHSGYFAAENLSEKYDIPLQDIRSSLELFQTLGLVLQISIADEANSTPEFTIFASTYRTVRPSDNIRQNDLKALEPNLEERTQ